jgi:hypothetical protein
MEAFDNPSRIPLRCVSIRSCKMQGETTAIKRPLGMCQVSVVHESCCKPILGLMTKKMDLHLFTLALANGGNDIWTQEESLSLSRIFQSSSYYVWRFVTDRLGEV